jgi:hypothetical protein
MNFRENNLKIKSAFPNLEKRPIVEDKILFLLHSMGLLRYPRVTLQSGPKHK